LRPWTQSCFALVPEVPPILQQRIPGNSIDKEGTLA
jgi:hypothetical protein